MYARGDGSRPGINHADYQIKLLWASYSCCLLFRFFCSIKLAVLPVLRCSYNTHTHCAGSSNRSIVEPLFLLSSWPGSGVEKTEKSYSTAEDREIRCHFSFHSTRASYYAGAPAEQCGSRFVSLLSSSLFCNRLRLCSLKGGNFN